MFWMYCEEFVMTVRNKKRESGILVILLQKQCRISEEEKLSQGWDQLRSTISSLRQPIQSQQLDINRFNESRTSADVQQKVVKFKQSLHYTENAIISGLDHTTIQTQTLLNAYHCWFSRRNSEKIPSIDSNEVGIVKGDVAQYVQTAQDQFFTSLISVIGRRDRAKVVDVLATCKTWWSKVFGGRSNHAMINIHYAYTAISSFLPPCNRWLLVFREPLGLYIILIIIMLDFDAI